MSDTTETETDTNTNTDEPSKAELHDRVKQLESTVEKLMPSRRDALRMGAAGIAGAAGLSATTQTADAATGSAGTIGSSGSRPDLLADDVGPRSVASNYLFAGEFSGSSSDSRLSSCLNAASDGDVIQLEATSYSNARTISQQVMLQGTNLAQTIFNASLTLNADGVQLRNVSAFGDINVDTKRITVENVNNFASTITVSANEAKLTGIRRGSVVFQSGTTDGIIDSSIAVGVTDNGSNVVADIS